MELAAKLHARPHTDLKSLFARAADVMLSLQFKATVLIVLLTLSVATCITTYLIPATGVRPPIGNLEQFLANLPQMTRRVAETLQKDPHGLHKLAMELVDGNPVLYIDFLDPDGVRIGGAEQRGRGKPNPHERKTKEALSGGSLLVRASSDKKLLELIFPIPPPSETLSGNPQPVLGFARVGMRTGLSELPLTSGSDVIVGITSIAVLVTIPLVFFLVRRIVSPLEHLAETMNSFSMGRLDVRSPIRRRDELGRLAQSFNQMADQHQQTHLRIVRLNAELEERVAYRTHQLRELASRDPLTGLYNRRHFGEALEHRYAEANRYQTDLSCIMIDLDDFKSANDVFGHQVGDQVLQLAAGTIASQLRTSDLAARYGGDEFILLLPQTDLERAHILGERIVQRFNTELSTRVPKSCVRMSMGIASVRSLEVQNAEMLIQAADHALYRAKSEGKNRIVTAAPAA